MDISVSGYRGVWNNYTLDGIANTDPDFNLYIQSPSIDALQEFKVQSGVYPAEFGWEAGAGERLHQVGHQLVSRSGV